jgi:organic radical activating enzyme
MGLDNLRLTPEMSLNDWKQIITDFPYQLKEVFISGGEPTLMPYCNDLIDYLTGKKILVTVFTNLSNLTLLRAYPSWYLRINASYHPQANKKSFYDRYETLKGNGYQITVDEVGENRIDLKTQVKHKITSADELKRDNARMRFAPDGKIYLTCYDLYYKRYDKLPKTKGKNKAA